MSVVDFTKECLQFLDTGMHQVALMLSVVPGVRGVQKPVFTLRTLGTAHNIDAIREIFM
jgi:hypothetical protein